MLADRQQLRALVDVGGVVLPMLVEQVDQYTQLVGRCRRDRRTAKRPSRFALPRSPRLSRIMRSAKTRAAST